MASTDNTAVAAWSAACDRLRVIGAEMLGSTDDDPREQLLALEHLVDQLVVWASWESLHADPSRPAFHRHNDLVSQWGGPNNDNVYRHARIEAGRRYVIRGRMHSCDDFLLAVRAGFMHQPEWGTLEQVAANELGIGPGEFFELRLGGDEPGAIAVPATAAMVSVREYYLHWTPEEPAVFTIECLDPDPEPPADRPPTAAVLTDRLTAVTNQVEQSLTYWDDYLRDHRRRGTDNAVEADTIHLSKGLAVARYEFCFWNLGAGEALVVEFDPPDARYWSTQLYSMGTFEPVDPYGCITSRNNHQTVLSSDGRVRIVVSSEDPGAPNWLDTNGLRTGLCTLRWFWPGSDDRPQVTTQVISVDEVIGALPADTEPVAHAQRADELAARQAHLRWRFRT